MTTHAHPSAVPVVPIAQPLRLSRPAPLSPGPFSTPGELPVADLTPISLDELNERAGLQTRVDRKYVLPREAAIRLVQRLDPATRVLDIAGRRTFRYHSVYFDSPELTSFHLTAYRRRRRFKIRTRTYVDSALCFLEVKTEGFRGGTVKERMPYAVAYEETVTPGRWFVERLLSTYRDLVFEPTLRSRYRRTTFHIPDDDSRATIDTDLTWQTPCGRHLSAPHLAVVETKTASAASRVDRLLWSAGHRPARISKYATGLAALRPDLPDVPWRRTLRRHFTADHA